MNANSLNLALRFILEITVLIVLALFGWSLDGDLLRVACAAGLPMGAALAWGLFAVPGDKSRSGNAPVPVPGSIRLVIEFLFFASAVWALAALEHLTAAWLFGLAVLIHYAISYKRLLWLIRQ